MLKRLLVLDGVVAVCRFQDDGTIVESIGMLPEEMIDRMGHFALWYRRMISGNTDVFSLFSQMNGWAPSRGWIVKGDKMSVCSVTNLVAMVENQGADLNEIMRALEEASHD